MVNTLSNLLTKIYAAAAELKALPKAEIAEDVDVFELLTGELEANPEREAAEAKLDALIDRYEAAYPSASKCFKCGGTGELQQYRHVAGGKCFKCDGTGKVQHGLPTVFELLEEIDA